MSLRRPKVEPPPPRTFNDMRMHQWREGEAKLRNKPAAIKVIEDIYGRVVPLLSDPLVEEDKRPFIVAMPDSIPASWKPGPDTPDEYQQAMRRYEKTVGDRAKRNVFRRAGEDDGDFARRQATAEKNATRGFGKIKKGREFRSSVNPY